MTHHPPPTDWVSERAALASDIATPGHCPRCAAPVLCARAGRIAALDVRADAQPIDPATEIRAHTEGRLTWCLATSTHGPDRIRWRDLFHRASGRCTHLVLVDHACPPGAAVATDGRLF